MRRTEVTAAIHAFVIPLAALSSSTRALIVFGGAAVVYVTVNLMVASYGQDKGYPFFPLFAASTFLGFPVVLLVVTIAAGPKPKSPVSGGVEK
jgi:hypothetical protein